MRIDKTSPLLNESRILREAESLAELKLFDRIDLVGVGQTGVPASEKFQAGGSRRQASFWID